MKRLKMIYTAVAAVAVLGTGLLTTGCSGIKGLAQPELDMPQVYMDDLSTDSLTIADMEWWEFFTDEPLRNLIGRSLEHNRDILQAKARVEEARKLYGIERVNMLPELTGLVGANNETNNYHGDGTSNDPELDLKASVKWEINLWGALTWAQRQSKANYRATVEELRGMRMNLIAEVAAAYFRLIALDNELDIVNQTLRTRSEALEQARLRFEGGLTSETVYQQAKVEYATTASLVPSLESQINQARNALTLLAGEYPGEEIERSTLYLYESLPERLPTGIPSSLLQRRPDLRVAEENLKKAMAGVGLSYANRFPNLNIVLTGGLENDNMGSFLKSPFSYIGSTITGPIFDFGRKKKKYEASKAAYDQARYAYEQSVIEAFTEVNNAVVDYRKVHQSAVLKSDLCDAAVKYVQLAHVQYRAGTLNYIDVLDAQRRYFDARISLSNALRDEYLAIVQLYKVLGGGLGAV